MGPKTRRVGLASLLLIIAATGFTASLQLSARISPALYTPQHANFWFDGDSERVIGAETDAHGRWHYRNSVHPLYSLLSYPVVAGIEALADTDPMLAVRIFHALIAGAWCAAVFLVLILLRLPLSVALPFTLLAMVSASSLFWFSVPETHGLGSLSILLLIALVAWNEQRPASPVLWLLAGAGTMSVTITNWSSGLLGCFACLRWKRAIVVTMLTVVLVGALAVLQRHFFPSSSLPLMGSQSESRNMPNDIAGAALPATRVIMFHSLIMPEVARVPVPDSDRFVLSIQPSAIGSGTVWGVPAALLWAGVLLAGAIRGLRRWPLRPMLVVVGSFLAQWLLHLLFGIETFLFALHYMPLLVLVAAGGGFAGRRSTAIAGWLLVVSVGANNWAVLRDVSAATLKF